MIDPENYGELLRSPLHGLYKLKASHVRIVYHVEVGRREVWVLMIADRRDIWRDEQGEIVDRLDLARDASRERHEATVKPLATKKRPRR